MSSGRTPVIAYAHSGVLSATWAASCAKPSVYRATYSWSYSFSFTRTFIQASRSAMSVPGFTGSQYFALPAATENRGSTTTSPAPRPMASASSCTCVLCMFSPRCDPMSVMQRAFSMSMGSGEPSGVP